MPSPFPGMNPYLERAAVWPDFHAGYIQKLRAQIAPQVPARYFVRVQEHLYFHELPEPSARLVGYADVGVSDRQPGGGASTGAAVIAAPATVELVVQVEERRTHAVEVIDRDGGRVVTVIEVLSPANKYAGPDRDQYVAKRLELLRAGVNYIEIDLLRGGPRVIPHPPPCDYYAMVARTPELPRAGVWPVRLRERLPAVPVPLRPGDPEPILDLQEALHSQYDEGLYARFIYLGDPEPQLSPEDAAWAAGFVPRRA